MPLTAAKAPSRAAFGSGRPRCSRAMSVAGTVSRRSCRKPLDELAEAELGEAVHGVDEEVAVRLEAGEEVDLVQQRGILDDQRVGLGDRLSERISASSMRQNATTGAPVRSEPNVGNACACRPSSNAATERSSAAVTTP